MDDVVFLSLIIFAAGLLYSSVGHAGASGYLAAMALFGLAPEVMKPTALVLNILVASIAAVQFFRAGYFSWSVFWPFALTSVPFAFIGGALSLSGSVYKQILGLILLFAAYRLFQYRQFAISSAKKPVPVHVAALFGAGIGLLSGAIGIGGGIFLSPLLLLMGWAGAKQTASVSAAFILVNSAAGIAGHVASVRFLPGDLYFFAIAAVIGGSVGSHLGSKKLANPVLYSLLAIVLAVAGAKLMLL